MRSLHKSSSMRSGTRGPDVKHFIDLGESGLKRELWTRRQAPHMQSSNAVSKSRAKGAFGIFNELQSAFRLSVE